MSTVGLYLLLLKASVTSFAGMGSLPQIRQDFVETYQLVTDEELSQAVMVGRSTPGPIGAYVIGVGYLAGGWGGAAAGWLAMITPAFAVLPLLVLIERWIHLARIRAAVNGVVVASAVLLVVSGAQLAVQGYEQVVRVATMIK